MKFHYFAVSYVEIYPFYRISTGECHKKEGLAVKRILRMNFLYLFVICSTLFFSVSSFASAVTIKGSTRAAMYGFFDSEMGWSEKSTPAFFRSNTSFQKSGFKGKTSSASRGQVRLGFKFKNIDTNTSGNITMDLWPKNFKLILSYVKQPIGKNLYIIIGKDWSLVNQRYFQFSCFVFKPYAAGFQGSKKNPQVQIGYKNILEITYSTYPLQENI